MTIAPVRTAYSVFRARVAAVHDLTPSLRRVALEGDGDGALDDLGDPGLDTRIKLVFADGPVADVLAEAGEQWYAAWLALPDAARPALRTYTTRRVRETAGGRVLEVDLVRHPDPGPAGAWAEAAAPGDRVLVCAPVRGVPPRHLGAAFAPPADTGSVLLVGDETALPAVSRTLEDLADDPVGLGAVAVHVLLEVPTAADRLPLRVPEGARVTWLPRDGAPYGGPLLAALGDWTPVGCATSTARAGLYAWVAGEAAVVRAARRHLVREAGVARERVTFMGYWRLGGPL
ncbi:siderophore-interacting protein [Lapillicoccus jejuensis]|uniref:siderophore-interacting protein n=1 Tax=Lapillicoccus jejuensis TaxID=402171 RepID=UPI001B87246A|nr:siderophore-interacting protein [Lapillicoccus jejuensis]